MLKKLFAALLAVVMVLALCACGEDGIQTEPNETKGNVTDTTGAPDTTTAPAGETTAPAEDNGKVTYTVKVVDEAGNPMANLFVQLCSESCVPGVTDADGVAVFNLPEADYHASVTSLPEGYTYTTTETEFYFEDGSTELTITLKAE